METGRGGEGVFSRELSGERGRSVGHLQGAHLMELEQIINYVSASTNPDGVRVERIR